MNDLQELTISELFYIDKSGYPMTFEVPIYQRNFAWEEKHIKTLIHDVKDAWKNNKEKYYIGTLVLYDKGNNVYEVIDGQQRLTTVWLILKALKENTNNRLTYRARKRSSDTLSAILEISNHLEDDFDLFDKLQTNDRDLNIISAFKYACEELNKIKNESNLDGFKKFFKDNVNIIKYHVPKDIDLNHYFEVMNSRGEQLEKHEIVKALLMDKLDLSCQKVFSKIWDACSKMNNYLQSTLRLDNNLFKKCFDEDNISFIKKLDINQLFNECSDGKKDQNNIAINDLIEKVKNENPNKPQENFEDYDYKKIIDFPNFLLIVLKIFCKSNQNDSIKLNKLNDNELVSEFTKVFNDKDANKVKTFAIYLLQAKFFLDTFIVHQSFTYEKDRINPWYLQQYDNKEFGNLASDVDTQAHLIQLLSMFEVTFGSYQYKYYLFHCLQFLFNNYMKEKDILNNYIEFLSNLADTYFCVYVEKNKFNKIDVDNIEKQSNDRIKELKKSFYNNYVKGTFDDSGKSENYNGGNYKQIPEHFIFNYLDYKIWDKYYSNYRSNEQKNASDDFGCDFDVIFSKRFLQNFYFSSSRDTLEHYYPQANAVSDHQENNPTNDSNVSLAPRNSDSGEQNNKQLCMTEINCLGNYALIGRKANSFGSNWDPLTKIQHYIGDESNKINRVGVASPKFFIMMQLCKNNNKWTEKEIQEHQKKMMDILFPNEAKSEKS